jgi:hypothetical protein
VLQPGSGKNKAPWLLARTGMLAAAAAGLLGVTVTRTAGQGLPGAVSLSLRLFPAQTMSLSLRLFLCLSVRGSFQDNAF